MRTPTPILEEELRTQIENAVIMFRKKAAWKALGMHLIREQGCALLFHGPPGTGKTVTARHLAKTLKHQFLEIDIADVGSHMPGQIARSIKASFNKAAILDENDNPSIVFLDECDTMLIDRSRVGPNMVWMLEPINALLKAIGIYPGLVILATNQKPTFLDPALERRLLGWFEFRKPNFMTRYQLWIAKWPKKLPVQLTPEIAEQLARYDGQTGATIETDLINWVSDTLRRDVDFNVDDLLTQLRNNHNGVAEVLCQVG